MQEGEVNYPYCRRWLRQLREKQHGRNGPFGSGQQLMIQLIDLGGLTGCYVGMTE